MKHIWLIIPCGLMILFVIALTIACLSGEMNNKNKVGDSSDNSIPYFESTGISVTNPENRIYNIVIDGNGYLYYCSSIEGMLEPVLDENGNITKDITIFTKKGGN